MPERSRVCWVLVIAVQTGCSASNSMPPADVSTPTDNGTYLDQKAGANHRNLATAPVRKQASETLESLAKVAEASSIQQQWLGKASYYSDRLVGNSMASGVKYESERPYAAHRTLPFGSLIRVVRLSTGASVVLRVMDRGPFGNRQRIVDVSRAAAERLELLRVGVADVRVELLMEPR